MPRGTALFGHDEQRKVRFSDEMFSIPFHPEPKPGKDSRSPHRCPYCEQPMPHSRTTVASLFCGGIRRLIVAILMIAGAAIRLIRLVLAGCLCLIGLIGAGCWSLGVQVAHPEERRLLTKPENTPGHSGH